LWRWIINTSRLNFGDISAKRPSIALRKFLPLAGIAALSILTGCRQDMQDQPKMIPQRGTHFFNDGRSARPQVEGTVARNEVDVTDYFHTGLLNGKEQDAMPFPVTAQVMARGQERYNIYCTPCHSRTGNGDGMIVERGYKPAANFGDAKRLAEPLSHYFYVATNGYGAMPDYSSQIAPEDRWAIAAYIRALQYSQNASQAAVPAGTKIENLADIATEEGIDPSLAGPWTLPQATNVQAIQPGEAPAVAPSAQPATPKTPTHPVAAPAGNATKTPAPGGN
jgi:mono/diheme cytochrome c family protein